MANAADVFEMLQAMGYPTTIQNVHDYLCVNPNKVDSDIVADIATGGMNWEDIHERAEDKRSKGECAGDALAYLRALATDKAALEKLRQNPHIVQPLFNLQHSAVGQSGRKKFPLQIQKLMQENSMTFEQACEMSLTQDLYSLVQEGALPCAAALQMLPRKTNRHTSLTPVLQKRVDDGEINQETALAQLPANKTHGTGLHNYGATCYFNALISALFHIPQVKTMQQQNGDTVFSSQFLSFRDDYFGDNNRVLRPTNLLRNAAQLHEPNVLQLFAHTVQHDPSEALLAMFNFTNNAGLARLRDMCTVHQTERKSCTRGAPRVVLERRTVFIKDIMFSEGDDLQRLQSPNMTAALQSTTATQSEKWGTCEAYRTRLTLDDPLPNIFMVNIKRLVYDRKQKNIVKVMTALNFEQDMVIKHTRYTLHAAILHGGSATGGHYVSRVLKGDGKWYECNDRSVSPVNGPSDKSQGGRQIKMLFYAKA